MNWYKYSQFNERETRALERYGNVVEVFQTGNDKDDYVIFIGKIPVPLPKEYPQYQLGLKRLDADISTIQSQFEKYRFEVKNPIKKLLVIKDKINEWIGKYGPILIASHNLDKQGKYNLILKVLGFKTKNIEIMGQEMMVLYK